MKKGRVMDISLIRAKAEANNDDLVLLLAGYIHELEETLRYARVMVLRQVHYESINPVPELTASTALAKIDKVLRMESISNVE